MNQAKLFENQNTQNGVRHYGSSIHYHYVSEDAGGDETNNGRRMVHSTITEMLANVSRPMNNSFLSRGGGIECFHERGGTPNLTPTLYDQVVRPSSSKTCPSPPWIWSIECRSPGLRAGEALVR